MNRVFPSQLKSVLILLTPEGQKAVVNVSVEANC